jgi:hypothetical protein
MEQAYWFDRSAGLITKALVQVGEADVIPLLDAAAQCQRIAMGEAPPTSMEEPGSSAEPLCSCPDGLAERGGFRSTCPVHGD